MNNITETHTWGYYCEFCKVSHISTSCPHPGQKILSELRAELAAVTARLEKTEAVCRELDTNDFWHGPTFMPMYGKVENALKTWREAVKP
jgi:hypothetical protein